MALSSSSVRRNYFFSTKIIQPTPNLSATMPKRDAKNVSASGICTWPPSANALNRRSPSAASGAVMVSAKPLKIRLAEAAAVGHQNLGIADAHGGVHDLVVATR
jgi:hypothetical protein